MEFEIYHRSSMTGKKSLIVPLIAIPIMILSITVTYIPAVYAQPFIQPITTATTTQNDDEESSEENTRESIASELRAALNDAQRGRDAAREGDLNTATQLMEDAEAHLSDARELSRSDPELAQEFEAFPPSCDLEECRDICTVPILDIVDPLCVLGCIIDCIIELTSVVDRIDTEIP
jgi:hypothetical protein